MGNDDRGPARHEAPQPGENLLFGLGVDGGKGVVEDQDVRIAQQRAGKGGAALLPARKRQAALADHGIVALAEVAHILVDLRDFHDLVKGLLAGAVRAEADIRAQRIGKQQRVLRHHAHGRAQGLADPSRCVGMPSMRTSPGGGIEQAGNQAPRACSCRCRCGRRWPRCARRESVKFRSSSAMRLVAVAEGDVVKDDFAAHGFGRPRPVPAAECPARCRESARAAAWRRRRAGRDSPPSPRR